MLCAASFWIASASSWSLMDGIGIRLTITECPLTAVATFFVLISFSVNSFEIALDTVPESTIMESTTISGTSGSRPRCSTSMPSRPRFSSTALMLEEPTSRPTIVFAPNPNMCPPLRLPGSFHGCLRSLLASYFHLVRLIFHPLIELRLLEAPAVAQLEGGDFLFPDVLVQRVRTHSQVLRSLANVHHFPRVGHSFNPFPQNEALLPRFVARPTRQTWEKIPRSKGSKLASSEFWCPEHISTPKMLKSRRISVFFLVLWVFSGISAGWSCRLVLYVVPITNRRPRGCGVYTIGSDFPRYR